MDARSECEHDVKTCRSSLRQSRKDACPGARALVEALQIVFLVRRVDAVVVETEADEERVETERALEVTADRDRATHPDDDRILVPLVVQRGLRHRESRKIVRKRKRTRALVLDELHRAIGGDPLAHESL